MINGGFGKHTLKLSRTHLNPLAHTPSPTLSLCLLILSYVHSVSDLISHAVTLSVYVSPQPLDSVTSESYLIFCVVHHIIYFLFYNFSVFSTFRVEYFEESVLFNMSVTEIKHASTEICTKQFTLPLL